MKRWKPVCLWIHQQTFKIEGCMAILKLDKHDEDKEIEFELDYLTSLTTSQRFEMMFTKTREMLRLLKKDGRRTTTEIIKRKPR
ncbi:MAG: hypothetical protein ACETWQ_05345 [Phycisphaerae bacterium]